MALDKETILAAKTAIEAYLQAHDALHAGVWSKDTPDDHTPLVNKLTTDLQAQGFGSVQEFMAAEKELAVEEFSKELLTFTKAGDTPPRFVDLSGLSLNDALALRYASRDLRRNDDISDTIHFRYAVSQVPVVAYAGSLAGERAKDLGVATLTSVSTLIHRSSFLWQSEVCIGMTTQGRFATLTEAKTASCALCCQTLLRLGISGLTSVPESNNIKLGARKLASTLGVEYDENGLWTAATPDATSRVLATLVVITLDFDYSLAEQVFADPDIRNKVITLKEIMGREVSSEEVKTALLEAAEGVFGKPVVVEGLNQAEMDTANGD